MTAASAVPSYDLLTCGETLLRLSPPGMQRLDQARLFEVGIRGSQLNVGCVLARLGPRVARGSRLPLRALGRLGEREARRHPVRTHLVPRIEWAPVGPRLLA